MEKFVSLVESRSLRPHCFYGEDFLNIGIYVDLSYLTGICDGANVNLFVRSVRQFKGNFSYDVELVACRSIAKDEPITYYEYFDGYMKRSIYSISEIRLRICKEAKSPCQCEQCKR